MYSCHAYLDILEGCRALVNELVTLSQRLLQCIRACTRIKRLSAALHSSCSRLHSKEYVCVCVRVCKGSIPPSKLHLRRNLCVVEVVISGCPTEVVMKWWSHWSTCL